MRFKGRMYLAAMGTTLLVINMSILQRQKDIITAAIGRGIPEVTSDESYNQTKEHMGDDVDYVASDLHKMMIEKVLSWKRYRKVHQLQSIDKNPNNMRSAVKFNQIFTQISHSCTYIFSVYCGNSTDNATWDIAAVVGWKDGRFGERNHSCCLLFNGSSVRRSLVHDKQTYGHFDFGGILYYCKVPVPQKPQAVSLVPNSEPCPNNSGDYVKAHFPLKQTATEVGICAKIVYGSLNPTQLVEWFEYQKTMGASTVVIYRYVTLNARATEVLNFYQHQGLVQVIPFDLPAQDRYFRTPGNRTNITQGYYASNDGFVVIADCQERLRGYKYVGHFDTDEYLFPFKTGFSYIDLINRTGIWVQLARLPESDDIKVPVIEDQKWYKGLNGEIDQSIKYMERLLFLKPDAAGFGFLDHLYIKSWGKMDPGNPLEIGQFLNRTITMDDRRKHLFLPQRLQRGTLRSHEMAAASGYKTYRCPPGEAVVKHFRSCRPEWLQKQAGNDSTSCDSFERITDKSMLQAVERILDAVKSVENLLGL